MGAFTDMLLPDKGSGEEAEKVDDVAEEGEPLPGTARHREYYPEGIADILKVRFANYTHVCAVFARAVDFVAWVDGLSLSNLPHSGRSYLYSRI